VDAGELSSGFFDRIAGEKALVVLEGAGHFPYEEPGLTQAIAKHGLSVVDYERDLQRKALQGLIESNAVTAVQGDEERLLTIEQTLLTYRARAKALPDVPKPECHGLGALHKKRRKRECRY